MQKIFNLKYTNSETGNVIEQPFSHESMEGQEKKEGYVSDKDAILEVVKQFEPEYEGKFSVEVTEVNRLPRKYINEHIKQRQDSILMLRAQIKQFRKLSAVKLEKLKEFTLEG